MMKVILTKDPETGRGLYENETKVLGIFASLEEAEKALGNLLRFCVFKLA